MSDPKYVHIGEPEDRLVEECAELILALQKGKRFGWFGFHPDRPYTTNLEECVDEINDVAAAMIAFEEKFRFLRSEHDPK